MTHPMTQPLTTGELVAARLRHAITTASNDDYSEVGSDKRARHVERIVAMSEAADRLEASATLERELEAARAALKLMHRRAQSAEGRVEAAKLPLSSWYKRTDPSSPKDFILRVVIEETLKALNRRAALQVEERKT